MSEIKFLKEKVKLLEKLVDAYIKLGLFREGTKNFKLCEEKIDNLNSEIAILIGG